MSKSTLEVKIALAVVFLWFGLVMFELISVRDWMIGLGAFTLGMALVLSEIKSRKKNRKVTK